MTDAASSSHGDVDETVFDQLLREDTNRRMHYGALYYAQHGIPVLPVKMVTDTKGKIIKKPGIKNWPNDATTDPTIINSWWGAGGSHEGYLVGAVTGHRSGWGVIDVDCKNGGKGFDSLQKLADELMPLKTTAEFAFGQLLPQERLAPVGLARTRSGGLHLWYPLGERSKVRGENPVRGLSGLEFKATGQYVVVAPSDGYEWLKLIPIKSEWDTPVEEYLATMPTINEKLLDRLSERGDVDSGDGSGGIGDGIKIIVQKKGSELLKSAVVQLMNTPDGVGNDTVWRLCCDLYPYVALGELTKVEVDQAIWAGIRNWGADEGSIRGTMGSAWKTTGERTIKFSVDMVPVSTNGNGHVTAVQQDWLKRELDVKPSKPEVKSIKNVDNAVNDETVDDKIADDKIANNVVSITNGAPVDTPTDDNTADHDITTFLEVDRSDPKYMKEVLDGVRARIKARDVNELYQEHVALKNTWQETDLGDIDTDPIPDVLVNDLGHALMYTSELNMAWGKRSAGKSWLTALAIRQQVLGGRHAVILDYENGRPRIRNRLRQIGLSSEQIKKYVHVFLSQVGGVPTRRSQLGFSLDDVGVVIVDSMTGALRAMDLDSLRGDDVETMNQRLMAPFKNAGACIIALDHVKHDSADHDRPINSVHKLNMVQGSGYQVENMVPFAPGTPGWSWIRLWKDNGGGTDKVVGDNVGRLCVEGTHDEVVVTINTDLTSLAVMREAAVDKVDEAVNKLNELGIPTDMTVKKAAEQLRVSGYSVGQNTVSEAQKRRRSDHQDDIESSA